ncbi:AfsR/SARP family transcriptional regulator [Streptomyces sp. 4N509B]|uniref:AfsR/SARP family transcriptional regulator n=1 Tax=Streptomyces sp. 4N509B TaxID=3457413 RepID=UPI003FD2EDF4
MDDGRGLTDPVAVTCPQGPDGAVEFRLLGPMELWVDGRAHQVPGPRQRRLLAVLTLTPNRVVSSDALVDALWDDEPPDTARRQVHNAVAALRRRLPPLRGLLVSDGPGYRIGLPEERIDAHRFTQALVAARAKAAVAGGRAGALRTLQEAIRLWRGPALAGLTGRVVEAAAARLEEQRLDAQELAMELRLADGESAALVPELTRLVDDNPLREGFAALLMRALHRSGRQPQALAVYERTRVTLAEELGVDPRPDLRALYQRVLRGEPDLPLPEPRAATGRVPAPRRETTATADATPVASASDTGTGTGTGTPNVADEADQADHVGPAATATPATAARPAAPRPDTLPYDITDFTGRISEVSDVLRLVTRTEGPGLPIVAFDGMAGVGKTTLAVRVARLAADRYPDGRLFVNLHGHSVDRAPLSPDATLDLLLRQLGVVPEQIPDGREERVARWRSEVAGRRLLVVLDNAADEAQVRPLLPGTSGLAVLITSRRRLSSLEGVRSVSLDLLPHDDAVALFRQVAGTRQVAGEPRHVDEVVRLCGCLPLALRIAGSRLHHRPAWTVAHLAHRLRDERRRLTELRAGDRDVRAAFAVSHQQLREDEQLLFRRLGLHPGPDVDAYDAAALLDVPAAEAERLLEELTEAHLLTEHAAGRYHFHDLLGSYARQLADAEEPQAERAAAALRLTEHYLHLAHAIEELVDPGSQRAPLDVGRLSELPTLRTIADTKSAVVFAHRTFVAVIEHAYDHGLYRQASYLSEVVGACLLRQGYVEEALTGFAVGLRAARATGDADVEAYVQCGIGFAHVSTGRFAEALRAFRDGLAIDRARGDELGAARTLRTMAVAHYRLGQYRSALEALLPVVEVFREAGSPRDLAITLSHVGITYTQLGEYDKAVEAHNEALTVDPHSHQTRLLCLFNLGWAQSRAGRYDVAEAQLREALRLNGESGSVDSEARGLSHLADCLLRQGRAEEALRECRAALTVSEGLDSPDIRSLALGVMGRVHLARGDLASARSCFDQALRATEGVGLTFRRMVAHDGRGRVAAAEGERELALYHWRQALALAEESGVPEASTLRRQIRNLGGIECVEGVRGVDELRGVERLGSVETVGSVLAELSADGERGGGYPAYPPDRGERGLGEYRGEEE